MTRPNLLQARVARRHSRRQRRGHAAPVPVALERDRALQRAREAGGPLDHACYACPCGRLFDAPVSTSVLCPGCGAPQAW